jgi:hypothetical protein
MQPVTVDACNVLPEKLSAFYCKDSLPHLWKSQPNRLYMYGGHLTPALWALYTEILP